MTVMTMGTTMFAGPGEAASPLLDAFDAFYRHVLEHKHRVEANARTGDQDPIDPAAVADDIRRFLESRTHAAAGLHTEALYVMACLADEVFLHLTDWSGARAWRRTLIEARLFDSHVGGERVFENLDRLLEGSDPVKAELAAVYLLALSLGFRGKYRGRDDGAIAAYRQRLFELIFRRPGRLATATGPVFPEAYAYTLERGAGGRLRSLQYWLTLWGLLIGLLVVLSFVVWTATTADLARTLDIFFDTATTLEQPL